LGREEAAQVGRYLAEQKLIPDFVLCSTATRTRETLAELQHSFSEWPRVSFSQRIYNASEADLFHQIEQLSDDVQNVMVVGHNPSLYQLSLSLAKDGDKSAHDRLQMEFPTCALVIIHFEGAWKDIKTARTKLLHFIVPDKN
jgi:phosphohistidine phosphatase